MQVDALKTLFEYNRKRLDALTAPSGHSWTGRKTPAGMQSTGSAPASAPRPDTVRTERPPAAAATVPPPRTNGSENKLHALNLAKVGRTAIETLNFGIHMYNIAKARSEDPKLANQVRRAAEMHNRMTGGDTEAYYNGLMGALTSGLDWGRRVIESAVGNMKQNFAVSGLKLTLDQQGRYSVSDYAQTATGAGWSVRVLSSGQVKVTADGADVSSEVDDRTMSGKLWSDHLAPGASRQALDVAV